jgi:hypothetical protein
MLKFAYLLCGLPTVAPRPTNRPIRPIPGSMQPVFPSPPLIFGVRLRLRLLFRLEERGKSCVLCSANRNRRNTIPRRRGLSRPIFIFLIHFEFYPTKWSRFEKLSSPMFLEFDLGFYIIFPIFYFFKFFEFEFQNSPNFEFFPVRIR